MGELLAYAGPGVTGDGIQRPKLGVEFDIFPNPGSGSRFYAGSRQDPERGNQEKQHIAAIYWGDDDYLDEYSWWLGSLNTYDDNRHGNGAGNSTEPTNPYQFDNGVYAENAKKWLKTKKEWHFRIEIDRASEATIYPPGAGSDAYRYITRVWARKNNAGEEFKNVKTDFDPDPDLEYEVFLHPDYHEMLKEVSAGFTQATGGETQSAEIYDFKMKFKKEE
jgi:hypothetical protein